MSSFYVLGRVVTAASAGRVATSARRPAASAAVARRFLAADAAASPPPPPPPAKRGGSSFLQRFSAFLTGAGLGCGVGYYHLAKEIERSNAALEKTISRNHRDLNDRLSKLEKR